MDGTAELSSCSKTQTRIVYPRHPPKHRHYIISTLQVNPTHPPETSLRHIHPTHLPKASTLDIGPVHIPKGNITVNAQGLISVGLHERSTCIPSPLCNKGTKLSRLGGFAWQGGPNRRWLQFVPSNQQATIKSLGGIK